MTRTLEDGGRTSELPPSDHLLRTFAAVPHTSRVLDLGCGGGRHTIPLARLGFDLHACDAAEEAVAQARARLADVLGTGEAQRRVIRARPDALGYPDGFFDWIAAYDVYAAEATRERLLDALGETRRVLKPGGWVYLTVPALPDELDLNSADVGYAGDSALSFRFTPATLGELMDEAGLAEAQRPRRVDDDGRPRLQAIYRRVEAGTPV